MLKFVAGLLIVCFTTFCGYTLAKKYRRKKSFFTQMQAFNERFLGEVSYYRRPIEEFLSNYSYEGEFFELLGEFSEELRRNGEEKEFFSDFADYPFLTLDEKAFVRDYFSMFGRGDSGSQKAYFAAQKAALDGYKNKSVEDCRRYGDLYLKLGFLFGLAVLVLIV